MKRIFSSNYLLHSFFVSLLFIIFVQPVQAYVDWGSCQVDSGVVEIDNGLSLAQASVSPTFSPPDPSKMFILSDSSGTSTVAGAADHMVRSEIIGGQYVFQREGSSGVVQVSYQVVYCPNDEFTVYRGTVPMTASNISASEVIGGGPTGPTVDLDRYFVTASVSTNDPNPDKASGLVRASLDYPQGEHVVLERAAPLAPGSIADIMVNYQVIEFSAESGVTAQHNTAVLSPGDDTAIHLADQSGVDYDFDLSRSWMYCTWDSNEPGLRQSAIGCNIADADTVTLHRYASLSNTMNVIRYAVIQFPETAAFVQRGTTSVDPASIDGDEYNVDVAITETGPANRAFSYTTNTTNGNGTDFPRQSWLERLINAVTVRFTFWRGEPPVGDSDATNFYWQTIHLGPYYEAQGWGWIGNSPDAVSDATPGYINFNCDNLSGYYVGTLCADGPVPSGNRFDYGVALEYGGCGTECNVMGQAWVGDYALGESPEYTIGMIDFDPAINISSYPNNPPAFLGDNGSTPENEQLNAHWNPETGELYGWARFRSFRDAEIIYAGGPSASRWDDWGWIQLRGSIIDLATGNPTGNEFGVTFNPDTQEFSGWAWSDDGTDPFTTTRFAGSGTGWIKFDLDTTTGGIDYLATKQGDVYASGDLNVPTPSTEYNATYLIQTSSGSITAFESELNNTPPSIPNEDYTPETGTAVIPLPDDNGNLVYRGDLGTLHINELRTTAQQDPLHFQTGPCVSSTFLVNTNPLNNEVFYCDGDLTIDTNQVFYNASGDGLGGGTIVVNGDLIIKDNMSYFNNAIASHINNLASVAWIVLGDVIIEPTVTNAVGAFIVLEDAIGDGGEFYTGAGSLQLTISGLVAASHFTFDRTDVGSAGVPVEYKPSEQIIYDGRVFANIPPGLEDFSKVFPRQ